MISPKMLLILLMVLGHSCSLKAFTGGNGEKKYQDGCVEGYITDALTGKPINGVTISVSSRNLPGKEIRSDAAGYFQFARLPAREVTILFTKKGYKLFKRDLPLVRDGASVKLSVEVEPVDDNDGGNEIWHPLLKLLD